MTTSVEPLRKGVTYEFLNGRARTTVHGTSQLAALPPVQGILVSCVWHVHKPVAGTATLVPTLLQANVWAFFCGRTPTNHSPWSQVTRSSAAGLGHLDILRWARAIGCDWVCGTCEGAACGDYLRVI